MKRGAVGVFIGGVVLVAMETTRRRHTADMIESVASSYAGMVKAMTGPTKCGAYIWPGTLNAQFMCGKTGEHRYHVDHFGTVWTDEDAHWLRSMFYLGREVDIHESA